MVRGEQQGLADMLEDSEIGHFSQQTYKQNELELFASTEESQFDIDHQLVEVTHKNTIFTFMMSKDDNLMLQMGGLISTLFDNARYLSEESKAEVPELFLSMAS